MLLRVGLESLTVIERWLCGPLIRRLLDRGRKTRELLRYGPEGRLQLCAARSWGTYLVLLGVAGVASAVAAQVAGAAVLFSLMWVTAGMCVFRSVGVARAGRRWREQGRV